MFYSAKELWSSAEIINFINCFCYNSHCVTFLLCYAQCFILETVVLIFDYCIALYCIVFVCFCLCVVLFLTSFMPDSHMTELWTYEMIYVLLSVSPKYTRKLCTTPAYKQHTDHQTDGFRKGITTENAAFRLIEYVLKSINQKKYVGGIFSDFE